MHQKLEHIAYNKLDGQKSNNSPTIVFMSGFKSDMEGTKAVFVEAVCKTIGQSFIRFDYFGHGKSGGKFEDGTITQWKNDALKVIDELTKGDLILIGSSMGGWISLLCALARPERVKGLIGIAAAPDFTEDLIKHELSEKQKSEIAEFGKTMIPNCYDDCESYPITKALIDDGENNLLLHKPININCPIRLLHGMADADVPFQTSVRIAEKVTSQDVSVKLIKNAGHRMSEAENLQLLINTLQELLQTASPAK